MQKTNKYQDMLDMPHPVSRNHPRMSMEDRAAQFSPFAALIGYGDTIRETRRLTERRIELEDEQKQRLNEKLQLLYANIEEKPRVRITYFVPDLLKEGGEYRTIEAMIRKIDLNRRELITEEKERIPIEDLLELEEERQGFEENLLDL